MALSAAAVIEAVKEYAEAHYENGGWDVVVEAYSDADIAEVVGKARSLKGALKKFKDSGVVSYYAEQQADAIISGYGSYEAYEAEKQAAKQAPPVEPAVVDVEECEHGLSAWLCSGPNHYPSDNPWDF